MSGELIRNLPFSADAEQSVLGAVLIKPEIMDSFAGIISAEDFYMPEHVEIYRAMQGMYLKSRMIDLVTLIDELVKAGVYDESGGKEYIRLIAETVPSAANALDYAKIVRDKSILRSLITACDEISEAAYGEQDDVENLVELAEKKIYSVAEGHENKNFIHIKDALLLSYERLNKLKTNPEEVKGMPTGFSALDKVLVGLGSADLVLVGARPGMGKTAFAMNIAVSAAKRTKKAVCVFSLEMSAEQLVTRLLSSEGMVDSYHLRSGELDEEEWSKIANAASAMAETDILIDDTTGITVSGMKAKLRRVKNLGLIVIDYLQLMQSEKKTDNRVNEVADISRSLKLMAKEFGVPVICCAQLSRGPEKRDDKRPQLSDLRDSGAIEQDADSVMLLYRGDYYDMDNPVSEAEVIIAKNRHGSVGRGKLGWYGKYTKFTTIDEDGRE